MEKAVSNKNCINLIRLIAAIQVFRVHAIEHLSVREFDVASFVWGCIPGVPVFFVLSGFLIWNSLSRNDSFTTYIKKRVLRVYPELWTGVMLSLVTILILYYERLEIMPFSIWIATQSTFLQFWTLDCLREFGVGTPNGALWTICVMVQSYLVLWFIYKFMHSKTIKAWIIVFFISIIPNCIYPLLENMIPDILYKLIGVSFVPYLWIFIWGAFLCQYFEIIIKGIKKYWFVFLLAVGGVRSLGIDFGRYATIHVLLLAPALLGFAYRYDKLNIKKDISYGIYIYHMVVINVLVEVGFTGSYTSVFIAGVVTIIIASISYKYIGNVFVSKKKRIA